MITLRCASRITYLLAEGEFLYLNELEQVLILCCLVLSDGKYGLFLDSSFCDGTTATCPTFDNEPLCGPLEATGTVRFECVGLEAWGISR